MAKVYLAKPNKVWKHNNGTVHGKELQLSDGETIMQYTQVTAPKQAPAPMARGRARHVPQAEEGGNE